MRNFDQNMIKIIHSEKKIYTFMR